MFGQILKEASDALACDWGTDQEYNVVDSIWFNDIGIVKVKTDHGTKCYIGRGKGISQHEDEQYIAAWGSGFHLDMVKEFVK